MPKTMKGPAIFLAQFAGDAAPFNSLKSIAQWAAGLGYKGVQIPTWDGRLFDLKKAAGSKAYCDEVKGICKEAGVEITELSTHLQGQLVAVNPAYDSQFDGFAPPQVHNNPKARQKWAVEQMKFGAKASRNLGLNASVTFSGALAFPYLYPWPQRPAGLIEEAFAELGKRWKPILDAYEDVGVDVGYEIHPGEDIFDGATFEMFLDAVGGHARANINYDPSHFLLQQLDYLEFIDIYHERIKAFHVKDAEFNPTGRQGVYSRLPGLGEPRRPLPLARRRAGRFRRHLLQAYPVRLRQLGSARMGMLPEASGGRRRGRCAVHPAPHHPRDRKGVRRFRRRHYGQEAAQGDDGDLSAADRQSAVRKS